MDEHCSCRKSGSGSWFVAAFHAFVLSIGGKEVWHSAWIVVPVFVAEKDNFSSSTESLYGSLKSLKCAVALRRERQWPRRSSKVGAKLRILMPIVAMLFTPNQFKKPLNSHVCLRRNPVTIPDITAPLETKCRRSLYPYQLLAKASSEKFRTTERSGAHLLSHNANSERGFLFETIEAQQPPASFQ